MLEIWDWNNQQMWCVYNPALKRARLFWKGDNAFAYYKALGGV